MDGDYHVSHEDARNSTCTVLPFPDFFCTSSGIRRGIHLDAMDRLLLLSREQIDRIMTEYKPPEEDEATCPVQSHSFFNISAFLPGHFVLATAWESRGLDAAA